MRARVFIGLVVVVVLLACGVVYAQTSRTSIRAGLFAQLRGAHEPSGGSPGRGSFAAVIHQPDTLCFGVTLEAAGQPSDAQLHRGAARNNGPAVLALSPPSSGDPGASSGCVTADATLLAAVRAHPDRFYVEITTDNGGVRGQLFTPSTSQDR
jgi:hypothetical protein